MKIELIQAGSSDAHELAVFNQALIQAEGNDVNMSLAELGERMQGFLAGEYDAFFLQLAKEKLGYVLLNPHQTPLYIRQLYILPEHQRKGYGSQVIQALKDLYDAPSFIIESMCSNTQAISFYEKLGFKPRYIGLRLDYPD